MNDYDESEFCPCGVTLMGYPGEDDGLCSVCAAAPHPGRDSDGYPLCMCDECEAYWRRIVARSEVAAERFNRQLVCSCGWTGPYIEHHRDRRPDCEVSPREDDASPGATSSRVAASAPTRPPTGDHRKESS